LKGTGCESLKARVLEKPWSFSVERCGEALRALAFNVPGLKEVRALEAQNCLNRNGELNVMNFIATI
jgi:predicted phage tail protein